MPRPGLNATAEPGALIAGRYRLEHTLGRGALGVVYCASVIGTSQKVALKLMAGAVAGDFRVAQRMEREARIASGLRHPSTVRVLDFGRADNGLPFIVLELLEGETLQTALSKGRLPEREAVATITAVLGSLAEAHAAGIVHRDVKPSNVFLCHGASRVAKLLDFGVARPPPSAGHSALTDEGDIVGTPAYMSPEQVDGAPVSPASDVYAAALLFAEMLTGDRVYRASAKAICLDKLRGEPPPFANELKSSRWWPILLRATALRPEMRFVDAGAMLAEVRRIGRRRPSPRLVALAAATLLCGGALVLGWSAMVAPSKSRSSASTASAHPPCHDPDSITPEDIAALFPDYEARFDRPIPTLQTVDLVQNRRVVGGLSIATVQLQPADPNPEGTMREIARTAVGQSNQFDMNQPIIGKTRIIYTGGLTKADYETLIQGMCR
ncbi:MAG: serine/threonine protein kinase [Polyangiaceae bacterium]|nr:serine/threonine protein kinase [Polyangiaceae bacterium]